MTTHPSPPPPPSKPARSLFEVGEEREREQREQRERERETEENARKVYTCTAWPVDVLISSCFPRQQMNVTPHPADDHALPFCCALDVAVIALSTCIRDMCARTSVRVCVCWGIYM
jgi:hypothetical protein